MVDSFNESSDEDIDIPLPGHCKFFLRLIHILGTPMENRPYLHSQFEHSSDSIRHHRILIQQAIQKYTNSNNLGIEQTIEEIQCW